MTNVRHKTAPMPMGCRWCGVPERDADNNGHAQRWVPGRRSWHEWEQPTREQVNARMNARFARSRELRKAAKEPTNA